MSRHDHSAMNELSSLNETSAVDKYTHVAVDQW